MEKELEQLKETNAEMFNSAKEFENQLDQAMMRIEELVDENNGMAEETQILSEQVYGLKGVNASQEELIH